MRRSWKRPRDRGRGAGEGVRDVTVPLIRVGLVSALAPLLHDLRARIFHRRLSQGPGTEVIGPLIVSLFGGGSLELVAALSVVNVLMVGAGLVLALRLGVRM